MTAAWEDAKAGEYELVALRWRKITSKPGEPLDYVQYRKGDKVDLNVEEARRLVKAGAVKPAGESDAADEDPDGPPAKSASKGDWEAYARSQGATDDDLEGQTKDDLIAAYGD